MKQCLASAAEQLVGPIAERWVFDDSGDPAFRDWLTADYPQYRQIHRPSRVGFGGAIRASWKHLRAHSSADWVLHLEEDFVFNRPVDLAAMATVLANQPYLAQMALRRQPWNAQEHAVGGIVEQHPEAYADCSDETGREWLEHRLFLTTNPCLYRRALCDVGWLDGPISEGRMGFLLKEDIGLPWGVPPADVRFGYWGARSDSPWVEHIGHLRTGSGY